VDRPVNTGFNTETISGIRDIGKCAFGFCSMLKSGEIPSLVDVICHGCFAHCDILSTLTFERDSKLSRINGDASYGCSSLHSVAIPSSVEILCSDCFAECTFLPILTFETGSRLSRIEESAFGGCWTLRSIDSPSSTEVLCPGYFADPDAGELGSRRRFWLLVNEEGDDDAKDGWLDSDE
jgi:hypothetical protein